MEKELTNHALICARVVHLIVAGRLTHQKARRYHYGVGGAHRAARAVLRLITSVVGHQLLGTIGSGFTAIGDHWLLVDLVGERDFIASEHHHLLSYW